jgi:putative membrane protein
VTGPAETQPERTALSWQRSGLGVVAVAVLIAHRALLTGRPALLILAGGTVLLGLIVLGALAPLRYRRVRRRAAANRTVTDPLPARAVSAVAVLTALAAAAAVLTPA